MKCRKCLALALCLCAVALCLGACSQVNDLVSGVATGEFPVEVNGVTINAKPQKALVLSPSLADVVLALGCESQVAAVGSGCTQEALQNMTKVDPTNAQAVSEAAPDVVLLDPATSILEQELKDAGLTVVNIAPAVNREDFERLYAQVSSVLNGGGPGYDTGIDCAQDIFLTLDTINRMVPSDSTVTTGCYLYDLDGRGVTGDMFGTTIMTYSGVTNAFGSLTGGQYDYDSLKVSDPYIIFCQPGVKEALQNDSRFSTFQAVQSGRVVEMDPALMELQGRTVVTAAMEISGAAFPELLEESSMEVTDPTSKIEDHVSSALSSSALEEDDTVYETLQQDDQGDEVLKMQTRLDELGYLDTDYDGYYGEHTASCVREFQKNNGLEETGVADPDTQRKMFSTLARAKGEQSNLTSQAPEANQEPSGSPEPTASPEPSSEGGT